MNTPQTLATTPAPDRPLRAVVPWFLALLGVFALLAAAIRLSPAPAAAPTRSAPAAAVGAPVTAGNWEVTVLGHQRQKEIPGASAFSRGETAKGEFVVVGLRVVNRGKENFGLNPWDFELRDGGGVVYRPASVYVTDWAERAGYEGEVGVDTRQLPPGVAGTYALAFDVAPDAQGLRLHLVQAKQSVPL